MRKLLGMYVGVAVLGLLLFAQGAGAVVGGAIPAPTPTWNVRIILPGNTDNLCSGALIARQWVLTAAHCVYKYQTDFWTGKRVYKTVLPASAFSILVGASTATSGGFRSSVDRNPIYQKIAYSNAGSLTKDIALLHLATPAPSSYEPLPLRFSSGAVPSGSMVRFAGWGWDGRQGGGILYESQQGDWILRDSCYVSDQACEDRSTSATSYADGGDSGAPVISYVRGGWIQVGVFSGPGGIAPKYGASALWYLAWIRSNAGLPIVAANTIVRDPASGASWLVEADGFRHWIPTVADYNCFRSSGIPLAPGIRGIFDAKSIPEDYTNHATCITPTPPSHTGLQVRIDRHATGGVSGHTGPANSYATGPTRLANSPIWIVCYVNGQSIRGPYNTTTIWDLSDDGFYYTDAWLFTGSNGAVVPACSQPPPPSPSIAISDNGGQMVVQLHAFPTGTSYYFCHSGDPSTYPLGGTITAHGQVQVTSAEQSWSSGLCSGTGNAWIGIQATDGHDYYSNEVTLAQPPGLPLGAEVGLRVQVTMNTDAQLVPRNCSDEHLVQTASDITVTTLQPSVGGWVTSPPGEQFPYIDVDTQAGHDSTPYWAGASGYLKPPDGSLYVFSIGAGPANGSGTADACLPTPPVGDVPVGSTIPFNFSPSRWYVVPVVGLGNEHGCLADVTLAHIAAQRWQIAGTLAGPVATPGTPCY